jgi:hypothetical protein
MSQSRTIEVHTHLSPGELYRANLTVCGTIETKRAVLFLISVGFLAAMIWKLLLASDNEVLAEFSAVIGLILFPVAAYGVTFGVPYILTRVQARKNPKILGPATYSFSEQAVAVTSEFGRSEVFWTAFEKIRETKGFFLLYILPRRAYALPKRCFSSKADISEFKELLQQTYRGKLDLRPAQ